MTINKRKTRLSLEYFRQPLTTPITAPQWGHLAPLPFSFLKQKEFAQSLTISSTYLSEFEAGKKNPGIDVIEKLYKRFNVNPSYLFTGEGDLFLQPKKKRRKHPAANKPSDDMIMADEMTMARKMMWYVTNIPVVRYAMLEFFKSYLFEKRKMVEKDVEAFLKANPGETRP